MNKPSWDNAGEPMNIEAAALDLLEWVDWLRGKASRRDMHPENRKRVQASMQAVYKFIPKRDALPAQMEEK